MRALLLMGMLLLPFDVWAATRRFTLIAGANDGGAERVQLRYATTDAQTVAEVMEELGGVTASDNLLLMEPDRRDLEAGITEVRHRVESARGAGDRTELLVYYSGHSDEEGLILGPSRFGYDELRRALDTIPADVRILILDSCASGAMIREKGGVHRAPFLVDESVEVSGHAYLTSSSADEVAQEADRLQGSYFTHALVTGLRGAADLSGDSRVTLNEAYHFAYTETLARTERTQLGPQHAAYDIRLNGTGDLVMTDISSTDAGLILEEGLAGRVFIRDDEGRLVVELYKPAERAVQLGLGPGNYTALVDDGEQLLETEFALGAGTWTSLESLEFWEVDRDTGVARGNSACADVPLSFTIGLPWDEVPCENHQLDIGVISTRAARLEGVQLSFGMNSTSVEMEGAQLSLGANAAHGEAQGFQGTVGINIVEGSLEGVQGASAVNLVTGTTEGAQLSSGVNITTGTMEGFQSSLGNYAGELHGAQLAVVNVTKDGQGTQFGLVNVAGSLNGTQIGLVNLSQDVDVAIGLFSFSKNGVFDVEVYTTEDNPVNVGWKYGGRNVYTSLSLGYRAFDLDHRIQPGLALGTRARWGRLSLDLDLGASSYQYIGRDQSAAVLAQTRAEVGFSLFKNLSLFAGSNVNLVVFRYEQEGTLAPVVPIYAIPWEGLEIPWWPGFILGVRV